MMHKDFWQREQETEESKKGKSMENILGIEKDAALIIVLIMILKKEKGDPLLILALLYILS